MKCEICGNNENNRSYLVKEMMFGTRDLFEYIKCSGCGCLQISEIPKNLEKYYPDNYYSFCKTELNSLTNRRKIRNFFMPLSLKYQMGLSSNPLSIISNVKYKNIYPWLNKDIGTFAGKQVLDVGCGSGHILKQFKKCGFKYLTGIDPYFAKNGPDDNLIIKEDIFTLEGKFDLIMCHHSFEHMQNPHKIFEKFNSMLSDQGIIILRIPVVDSYAWRKYGTDWFQIDAPRHLFLHSVKSMTLLANKHEFRIQKLIFDSTWHQFYFSEKYQENVGMIEKPVELPPKRRKFLAEFAENLNMKNDGDQACFYLTKHK